jgi:hypothetical protein
MCNEHGDFIEFKKKLAELPKKNERKKNRCPDLVKIRQHRFLGYFPNFTLFFNVMEGVPMMSVQASNSYCITLKDDRQQLCSCSKIAAESLQFHPGLYTTIM